MATTQYQYVYHSPIYRFKNKPYKAQLLIDGVQHTQRYATIKEAALAVDKILISYKKDPVNILTKKPKT